MSHSTHVGFSCPPAWAASVGVGHIATAVCKLIPVLLLPSFAKSGPAALAFGVGHIFLRAIVSRLGRILPVRPAAPPWFVPYELAAGVGNIQARHPGCFIMDGLSWFAVAVGVASQDPDPVPLVRCAGMVRAQHSPFRIEPHRGQVSENGSESARSEHWAIFHEDEARLYFANDPSKLAPKPRLLAFDAFAFASDADVLARESARHHVNTSAPRLSVKGSHVIPDREGFKTFVVLSSHENVSGIGLVFDSADCSPSEQLAAEYSATSARE